MLIIMRGLPGTGKSTLAKKIAKKIGGATIVSADDYFIDARDGVYKFRPSGIGLAHRQCQSRARLALERGQNVIVDNTSTQSWESQPYRNMAEKAGAAVEVVDLFDGGLNDKDLAARNTHGVPAMAIARMRARWE